MRCSEEYNQPCKCKRPVLAGSLSLADMLCRHHLPIVSCKCQERRERKNQNQLQCSQVGIHANSPAGQHFLPQICCLMGNSRMLQQSSHSMNLRIFLLRTVRMRPRTTFRWQEKTCLRHSPHRIRCHMPHFPSRTCLPDNPHNLMTPHFPCCEDTYQHHTPHSLVLATRPLKFRISQHHIRCMWSLT